MKKEISNRFGKIISSKITLLQLSAFDALSTVLYLSSPNGNPNMEANPFARVAYEHFGNPGLFLQKSIGTGITFGFIALCQKLENRRKISEVVNDPYRWSRRLIKFGNITTALIICNNIASIFVS